MTLRVVIPSRSRADMLAECSLKIFPQATVCVEESEAEAYSRLTSNLLLHPPLPSLAAIRNWILDNVPDRVVLQADDDIERVISYVGVRSKSYTDPSEIMQIVENCAEVAQGFGCYLFGFNQTFDPKTFRPQDPFRLNGWVGSVVGFLGRSPSVRADPKLKLRGDIELSMRSLLKQRVIFVDSRFHFVVGGRFTNRGGNASNRSEIRERAELSALTKRWGRFISFGVRSGFGAKRIKAKTTVLHVKRRQG